MGNMKKLVLLGVFDIIIGISFVFSNVYIWERLNGNLTSNAWGPLQIGIIPQTIMGGEATIIGTWIPVPNYPFILFWVALAVNFVFVVLALKSNKTKG